MARGLAGGKAIHSGFSAEAQQHTTHEQRMAAMHALGGQLKAQRAVLKQKTAALKAAFPHAVAHHPSKAHDGKAGAHPSGWAAWRAKGGGKR